MSTFTIDAENNITAFAVLPTGTDESQSFSTAKELAKLTAEWPMSRLIDTWNRSDCESSFCRVHKKEQGPPIAANRSRALSKIPPYPPAT